MAIVLCRIFGDISTYSNMFMALSNTHAVTCLPTTDSVVGPNDCT